MRRYTLPWNLQLFAGEEPPAPAAGTPSGNPQAGLVNPLRVPDANQQQQQQTAPATPQAEELDFGGRKIPVTDPTLKDLHGDWREMNRTLQSQNQYTKQLETQLQMQQQQLQTMNQLVQQQQQQAQPAAPQLTPEEIQAQNEAYLQRFYDNPQSVIAELAAKEAERLVKAQMEPLQQFINPIVQERQLSQNLNQLSQQYPDMRDMLPHMQEVINQYPDLANTAQGLERAYWQSKANLVQQQTQQTATDPNQLMNDPNFRQQLMQNQDVRNAIISDYVASVQNKQQQTPTVVGTQPGGQAPALPPDTPKDLRSGTKAWLASMRGGTNG